MGVSSELVDGVLVFTPAKRVTAVDPIVALYYIDRGYLLAFSLPVEYNIDFSEVVRSLKLAGYPIRERRHIWRVICWRGQNLTLDLPGDTIQVGQCRIPMHSAILDLIDEYNDAHEPDDGFYVSQLVTV